MKNNRLLRALNRQSVDATPIWIMRQAGRYLPEYRKLREKAGNFMTMCQTPEIACEITLQPLARFDLDAAIIFSDILTIPDAMGLGLGFTEGSGPAFKKTLDTETKILSMQKPDMAKLQYVADTIKLTVKALADRVPLIGFAGSPWTLATYMIEGGSSKTFAAIKKLLYTKPDVLNYLLDVLAESVADYLLMQATAGASVLMIFDTWGGVLSAENYQAFSLSSIQKIIHQIRLKMPDVPIIIFTKNGGLWLESMVKTGANALGLDWTIALQDAKNRVGHQVALQGNLDPSVLYADAEVIQYEAKKILDVYAKAPGHIFNLGHGITPEVDPDRVKVLVDFVHEYSAVNVI